MADNIEASRLNSALHQVKYADNLKRDSFKELEILLLQQKGHDNLNYDFKIYISTFGTAYVTSLEALGKWIQKKKSTTKWQGALAWINLLFRKYFKRVGFLQSPVIWYHKTIKVSWKDHVGSNSLNDPKKPFLLQFISQMILPTWSDSTMSNHIPTVSNYIPMILICQILL